MIDEKTIINEMPKVELHLHLEGAFTFDFLFELIRKYKADTSLRNASELEKKFTFRDFDHFLELWFWKNQFFREAEDFEECTYTTLKDLNRQHVVYCEAFYSPWDFTVNNIEVEEITEAILKGVRRASADYGIHCQLIADIVRDYGSETATERVLQVLPFIDSGVIGIGLGGSERKYQAQLFRTAFEKAAEEGFHRVAHAGEGAGPESVWQAIQELQIERIGHGVRAVEDPELISFIQHKQIPLEICVISNLKTKVYKQESDHPIRRLFDSGILVTINSDDPAMFNTSISNEFMKLYDNYGFTLNEIRQLSLNAVDATFLSPANKQDLRSAILDFWKQKVQ